MRNKRILCFTLSIIFFIGLINIKQIITKADTEIYNKPEFDIKINSVEPNPAIVEKDNIIVTGEIIPKNFKLTNLPVQERDIVIVIDKSTDSSGNEFTPLMQGVGDFISSMYRNDKYKGTRVGVISYDKTATIHPIMINNSQNFLADAYEYGNIIKEIFNGNSTIKLSKGGQTNTGEALRKAEYLLHSEEGNKNANKIIILVSDSNPDTITELNGEFYTDILQNDNSKSNFTKKDLATSIEYTNTIGKIINSNKDKVFTLAFNSTDEAQETLKQIHVTMSGYSMDNNITENEDKGFFITNRESTKESIVAIFNKINRQIIDSYRVDNIKMNINFENNFSLTIGGNIVDIGAINYNLYSNQEEIDKGIFKYRADPIPFQFKIKADKIGKYEVCNNIDIKYNWQEKEIIQNIKLDPALYIEIESNEVPNIGVELKYPVEPIQISDDSKQLTIEYSITPRNFNFTPKNNGKSEVILLLDISKGMSGNRWNNMRNGFDDFKNSISKNDNISIGVVTYNSNANAIKFDNNYFTNDMEKLRLELLNLTTTEDNSRNIGEALKKADEMLEVGDPLAEKTIVLLASGEVSSNINLNNIKSKGYNIISIQIDCGYPSQHSNNTLKYIHQSIGGEISDDSYIVNKDDHNEQNNTNGQSQDHNNNGLTGVIKSIPEKIKKLINNNYIIKDAKLYFNLGENFIPVENQDMYKNLINVSGNIYSIPLRDIVYKSNKEPNYDGLYTYSADKFTISFEVKLKNNESGVFNFVKNDLNNINNYLQYSKISNNLSSKLPIDTPTVIVGPKVSSLEHGLYNGINGDKVEIQESNNGEYFNIAQGSTVTFGSTFIFSGNNISFELNIDNKFNNISKDDIKIFMVSKDNNIITLNKLGENINIYGDNNKFNIDITNISTNNTQILVVYKGKIKENIGLSESLKNEIKFSSILKDITIVASQELKDNELPILPDLF